MSSEVIAMPGRAWRLVELIIDAWIAPVVYLPVGDGLRVKVFRVLSKVPALLIAAAVRTFHLAGHEPQYLFLYRHVGISADFLDRRGAECRLSDLPELTFALCRGRSCARNKFR
jgi:hypothetical protein